MDCSGLGIFVLFSNAMQALCVTCAMHFPLLEADLTILYSVPGVIYSLRSSSLHISLGSTWIVDRSVYTHPYMTVLWFLFCPSILFCADFSRIHSVPLHDKLPNLFDSEAWTRYCLYLFTCITSPHQCLHSCYHHSYYEYDFTTLNAHVPVHPGHLVPFPDTRHLYTGMYLLVCTSKSILFKPPNLKISQ